MQERAVRTLERGDELQAGGVDSFSNAGPCAPENHHGGASLEPPEKKENRNTLHKRTVSVFALEPRKHPKGNQ